MTTPRGLAHAMHAVHDLPAAAAFYERIGFALGGLTEHPWGARERAFRLSGFLGGIVSIADQDGQGDDSISEHFRRAYQAFVARREGLWLLSLASSEIARDAAQLRKDGIADSDLVNQTIREASANGAHHDVELALILARDALSPDACFALAAPVKPPLSPQTTLPVHGNGAVAASGIVLVADNPTDHHIFMSKFSGVRDFHSSSSGLRFKTLRGEIEIMTPVAYNAYYGVEWRGLGDGAVLAAMRIVVRDLAKAQKVMTEAGITPLSHRGRLIVPPNVAHGATLVFEVEASS